MTRVLIEGIQLESFAGKLAVITGGGTGMGRELAKQLIAEGCDVAICDVIDENMAETIKLCEADAPQGIRITAHRCDVSNEQDVERFRDEVVAEHKRDHINLLFNNAGIGGVASFIDDPRQDWERTFNICWYGVYYSTRAFMPLMVASDEAHLINTSSINGFWATLGPGSTHSSYSASKFAVKGFSEALISDLRLNAPHVNVSVVMPGHIGTSIAINTGRVMDRPAALDMSEEQVLAARKRMTARGVDVTQATDDQIREFVKERGENFRDNAPTTASEAAAEMLKGVREKRWRILLGEDARILDEMVRANPEAAYEDAFSVEYREKADWQLG
ncbi:MAG: NAD(P)-dependent dehydrogenase (short-subunit alcohol dehydrogenase family) [Planctomycetaceae bacterium]|jgi:NAD(P)-dependent dehydrogenase (short-subunit alcohol dehydrogenase family)